MSHSCWERLILSLSEKLTKNRTVIRMEPVKMFPLANMYV